MRSGCQVTATQDPGDSYKMRGTPEELISSCMEQCRMITWSGGGIALFPCHILGTRLGGGGALERVKWVWGLTNLVQV